MKVDIITPEQQLSFENVSLLQLPGVDGLFEILPGHAPLISALGKGKAKMVVGSETRFFSVSGGVAEVLKDYIKVMAEMVCSE